jgi:two-component system CheB/CheR fusion protein
LLAANSTSPTVVGHGMQPEASRKPLRVLVVDDSIDAAETLRILVELWGHEACTAHDAATARQLARSFLPHVILLDIQMPRTHGGELAGEFRDTPGLSPLYLIATTATEQTDRRLTGFTSLFDSFLRKPYNLEELEQILAAQAAKARN